MCIKHMSSQERENTSAVPQGGFAFILYAGKWSNRCFVGQMIDVNVKCYKITLMTESDDNYKISAV
jgi:hypothetical protein